MPFFKTSSSSSSKAAKLGSTPSEVTLVDPMAGQLSAKGASAYTQSSKHPKQKPLSSQVDKFNTIEARLAYIVNK